MSIDDLNHSRRTRVGSYSLFGGAVGSPREILLSVDEAFAGLSRVSDTPWYSGNFSYLTEAEQNDKGDEL